MLAQVEKIQKIEVGLAGWPEIFGPGFNVVAGLVLDEVAMLLGTMSCIRMTSEWYLKLAWIQGDNLGLQNPFQLVLGLILRLFWNKSGADFEPI